MRHLALLRKLFLDFRLLQLISEDARLNNPSSKLSFKTVASQISTGSLPPLERRDTSDYSIWKLMKCLNGISMKFLKCQRPIIKYRTRLITTPSPRNNLILAKTPFGKCCLCNPKYFLTGVRQIVSCSFSPNPDSHVSWDLTISPWSPNPLSVTASKELKEIMH